MQVSTEKTLRLEHANALIKIISDHGRRFFWNERNQRLATLKLDRHNQVWLIDDYSGVRVNTHKENSESWRGFSHGGTLRSLIQEMRNYVTNGEQLGRGIIAPERYQPGNIWGYSDEAATAVRAAAFALPIMAPAAEPVERETPDQAAEQADAGPPSQNPW